MRHPFAWIGSALVALAAASARTAAADLEAFVLSGDKVAGDVGPGGETDTFRLGCFVGDVLDVSARAAARNRAVLVRLRDVDGTLLIESSGRSVRVASAPLAATGTVSVEITGAAGGTTRYTATLLCGVSQGKRKLDLRSSSIGAGTTTAEAGRIVRSGGSLAVPHLTNLPRASVIFGPGATPKPVTFVAGETSDLRPASADLTPIGPAMLVGPLPQFFAVSALVEVSLPYHPADVRRTVQVLVGGLDGRIAPVRAFTVDEGNSVVRFRTSRFGIFQVFDGTSSIGPVMGNSLVTFDALPNDAMSSVAVQGPRIVVGIRGHVEDVGGIAVDTGAAYVFDRVSTGGWQQVAKLVPPSPAGIALLGRSIALDGTRVAVGGKRITTQTGSSGVGAVFVFDLVDGVWTHTAEIDGTFVTFGADIALQGDRIAVGMQLITGSVRMYQFDGTSWVLDQTISESSASFGSSVALDGERLLVGARGDGFETGRAYAYSHASGRWALDGTLVPAGASSFAQFGSDVSLQGDRAAIGAWANQSGTAAGSVFVFERVSGLWKQAAQLDNPVGRSSDRFGSAVVLHGDRILIGAPDASSAAPGGGMLYLARRGTGSWSSGTTVAPAGIKAGDQLGAAIAFEGNRVVAVAAGEDDAADNAGVVHVVDVTGH
jgi:hypothetical protein